VCREAFDRGLLMETSGAQSEVVKLMPPLLIDDDELARGLAVAAESIEAVMDRELIGAGTRSVDRSAR
jgi:diaminobutyrate-2-oxoglutarate transaminase